MKVVALAALLLGVSGHAPAAGLPEGGVVAYQISGGNIGSREEQGAKSACPKPSYSFGYTG
jgi:hypothetical protein